MSIQPYPHPTASPFAGLASFYPSPLVFHLVILDLRSLYREYIANFSPLQQTYNLGVDELDASYDWCVKHALNTVLMAKYGTNLQGFYRHDVYKCVYDAYPHWNLAVEQTLQDRGLTTHLTHQPVKILVAGDNAVLAFGVPRNGT